MFRACLNWLALFAGLFALAARSRADSAQDFRRAVMGVSHTSISGQFVVHDTRANGAYFSFNPTSAANMAQLQPELLTVSCERIKQALLTRLGARDQWRGKIYLDLHRCVDPDEMLTVTPVLQGNDWTYRIQLPDVVNRPRLVSVVVQVLLLEMANRQTARSAEIPTWLAQGLAQEVILSNPPDLVLDPPKTLQNGVTVSRLTYDNRAKDEPGKPHVDWMDPLAQAREYLHASAPLTLEELNWPKEGELDGPQAEAYRDTAQLFVHDLLKLPDGRAAVQSMLGELPQHLNWQLSFLHAFRSDFANQLAVDKWWMLQLAEFTGRDLSKSWAVEESWAKLDDLVRPAIEVHTSLTEPTLHAQVTLQAIIRNWDVARQEALFRDKSHQLFLLRLRVSQDLIRLADDYRRVLDNYLRIRERVVYVPMGRTIYAPRLDDVARDTIRQLDELDVRRQQLRPRPAAPVSPAINISSNH